MCVYSVTWKVLCLDGKIRGEGSKGYVIVEGAFASRPDAFTGYLKGVDGAGKRYEYENLGGGFFWEADAVAHDIFAGRIQNEIMARSTIKR